jgi:hypothetical protein
LPRASGSCDAAGEVPLRAWSLCKTRHWQRIDRLDRARCRQEAERRFSPSRTAEQCEQVDARLLGERAMQVPALAA